MSKSKDLLEIAALFKSKVKGAVFETSDEGYAQTIKGLFPLQSHARKPLLIVQPANALAVREALLLAQQHQLPISVKGGGHSHYCVFDERVLIDLSSLNGIFVDCKKRTARVGGGVVAADLEDTASLFGLAAITGSHGSVGCAGFLQNGGYGLLSRRHGFLCDQMVSLEVLLWDGSIKIASRESNQDLFEACHGGAPEIGIILSMEMSLFDVSKGVLGTVMLQGAETKEVSKPPISFFQAMRENPNFSGLMLVRPLVDGTAHIITRMMFLSEKDEPKEIETLENIKASAKVLKGGTVARLSYHDFKNMGLGGTGPPQPRARSLWNYAGYSEISAESVSAAIDKWNRDFPSFAEPSASVLQVTGGGNIGGETLMLAKDGRSAHFTLLPVLGWKSAEDDQKAFEWLSSFGDFIRALPGNVSSHLGYDTACFEPDGHQFLIKVWGEHGLAKVQEAKMKYDPKGVFGRGILILQEGLTLRQKKLREFWFRNSIEFVSEQDQERWFVRDKEEDDQIRISFANLVQEAADRKLEHWKQTAVGSVCLVLLLSCLPRHIFRGSQEMFIHDSRAGETARLAIHNGQDLSLSLIERFFLYSALTLAADVASVHLGVQKLQEICALAPESQKPTFSLLFSSLFLQPRKADP
eukprot:TRINITY_DN3019_c0_g1_i1.p1 TRINITY_DN3019_c0_g1~~TRINITY_DN3019_c0_g1_i1.p1  ORF type:complete len:653 (-),score=93.61 TRINITY_DN3019_c0_g1_i1:503-2422(-)